MEEKTASSVNINIYGGTNQILPNATKAEQHFHYEQGKPEVPAPDEPSRPWSSDDERRLSLYIEKEETLRAYIATLAACTTAQQVGEAVAQMCADDDCKGKIHPSPPAIPRPIGERQRHRQPPPEHQRGLGGIQAKQAGKRIIG